jgi:hypothetical protein
MDMWDMDRCVFCGREELSGGKTGEACAGYDMIAERYARVRAREGEEARR